MRDHAPPLFKQGVSARVKVVCFVLLALSLLVADARLHTLEWMRQTVANILHPIQQAALMPRDVWVDVASYFARLSTLQEENKQLRQQLLTQSITQQEAQQLRYENAHLRQVVDAGAMQSMPTLMATILYEIKNSTTLKIMLNRGKEHGVGLGHAVIDDKGLVGQVTEVYPLMSEVTLLTDKAHATPVQVQRTGLRAVLYGTGQHEPLRLRLAHDADIRPNDIVVTSGIDRLYPPSVSVARVTHIKPALTSGFKEVLCEPIAGLHAHREVLVVLVERDISEPSQTHATRQKINRKITRDDVLSHQTT